MRRPPRFDAGVLQLVDQHAACSRSSRSGTTTRCTPPSSKAASSVGTRSSVALDARSPWRRRLSAYFTKSGLPKVSPEIGEAVDRLLPADHAVGVVVQDQHDQVELQPDRGLQFLAVHHEAAVAADRHHAPVRIQHGGHHRRRQAGAHGRQRIVQQQGVGDMRCGSCGRTRSCTCRCRARRCRRPASPGARRARCAAASGGQRSSVARRVDAAQDAFAQRQQGSRHWAACLRRGRPEVPGSARHRRRPRRAGSRPVRRWPACS